MNKKDKRKILKFEAWDYPPNEIILDEKYKVINGEAVKSKTIIDLDKVRFNDDFTVIYHN